MISARCGVFGLCGGEGTEVCLYKGQNKKNAVSHVFLFVLLKEYNLNPFVCITNM